MKLSITQKCSCRRVWQRVKETVWEEMRVCFTKRLLALEPLAAASDSVSSSPFIRSASHRCHLSFPCAYITHVFGLVTIGSQSPWGHSGWLVDLCSDRLSRERSSRTAFPSQSVNMQTAWLDYLFSCHMPKSRLHHFITGILFRKEKKINKNLKKYYFCKHGNFKTGMFLLQCKTFFL